MYDTIITKLTSILQDYNLSQEQIDNVIGNITPDKIPDLTKILPAIMQSASVPRDEARSITNAMLSQTDKADKKATDDNVL